MNEEILRELTETTARSKSNTHRIDDLESQYHLMHEMNKNIAVIAEQTKYTKEDVTGLKKDVEEIKSKPIRLVDKAKEQTVAIVIGAIIGAVMSLILM